MLLVWISYWISYRAKRRLKWCIFVGCLKHDPFGPLVNVNSG